MPGFPVHHQLQKLAQTHVHQVGDAIQPSHPRSSLLLLPSIFPGIRVFSKKSVLCIRWPKHWSFSFNISSSNEHSGLVSLRMDWLDLLFFIVQLSHPYLTAGKTIALIRWTFVSKVMSLLFNILSRLVIVFLQGVSIF